MSFLVIAGQKEDVPFKMQGKKDRKVCSHGYRRISFLDFPQSGSGNLGLLGTKVTGNPSPQSCKPDLLSDLHQISSFPWIEQYIFLHVYNNKQN